MIIDKAQCKVCLKKWYLNYKRWLIITYTYYNYACDCGKKDSLEYEDTFFTGPDIQNFKDIDELWLDIADEFFNKNFKRA